jgi:ribosomal-protein-alanine N-acetyltransferase
VTTRVREDAVSIRRATRADLLEVFRIEQAAFPEPWPFAAFERYLDVPGFLVAVDESRAGGTESGVVDGGVVGYVVATPIPNHGRALGHVKDIAVHPEHRGRGVGSSLLDAALSVLSGEASSVKLEVRPSNDAARSLYDEFGFEVLKAVPSYYADGEDALVLVRDLSNR